MRALHSRPFTSPLVGFSARVAVAACVGLFAETASADQVLTFDGVVTKGGLDHVAIPFDVPAGVHEIQVDHDYTPPNGDILDWGVTAPDGFRGWGGGNKEPAVVGELASSRSYLTGPITTGAWRVNIGKAKLLSDSVPYHVVVTLRTTPTLSPQPERRPYVEHAALSTEARWYAGDLHAHSRESGDASPTIDDLVTFARTQGLDFVELSDHNTVSQLDFIDSVQANHGDILIVPGVEFTTYAGHANGVGATQWVDHKIGQPGVTIEAAAQAFRDQGAIFSINHPLYDLGNLCIGCSWKHQLSANAVDAVEIATSGTGDLFGKDTLAFWDKLSDTGRHLAALAGSDDHGAGQKLGSFSTPVGTPTTYVYAKELSVSGILDGIRRGHTLVKFHGVSDPMVQVSSEIAPSADGDTVQAETTTFHAKITGGAGLSARWVVNGLADPTTDISGDTFDLPRRATAPKSGQDRYRVEVVKDGNPTTVTSHIWLEYRAGVGTTGPTGQHPSGGCQCALGADEGGPSWLLPAWLLFGGAAAFAGRRRTRPNGAT